MSDRFPRRISHWYYPGYLPSLLGSHPGYSGIQTSLIDQYTVSSRRHTNTRRHLTELLLEHYPEERTEAQEHLNFAIKEFREMKMQPSLERALRHKEILGA